MMKRKCLLFVKKNVNINVDTVKNKHGNRKKNQSKLSSLNCEESYNLLNKFIFTYLIN